MPMAAPLQQETLTSPRVCVIETHWRELFKGVPDIRIPAWTSTPTIGEQLSLWRQSAFVALAEISIDEVIAQARARRIPRHFATGWGRENWDWIEVPDICTRPLPPPLPIPSGPIPELPPDEVPALEPGGDIFPVVAAIAGAGLLLLLLSDRRLGR